LNLNKYDVLIFDCDGVIFDTTNLKLAAFEKVLKEYDKKHIRQFTKYFRSNFGKSRFLHARYFIENILNEPFQQKKYDKIISDFSKECKTIYDRAKFCKGVVNFLKKNQKFDKYVASGSEQEELRGVFDKRGINSYFISIFGSPRLKNDLVKDICSKYNHNNILMIGDAEADFKAAKFAGIDFLYISRYSVDDYNMKKISKIENFKSIIDLSELV
tara:strand:+ start:20301 stop:20945 length:645 start_codon:yes stop_codon:yes gene_type:complete